jgi:DNA polymerase sigma
VFFLSTYTTIFKLKYLIYNIIRKIMHTIFLSHLKNKEEIGVLFLLFFLL